jgi:hypothetical protein
MPTPSTGQRHHQEQLHELAGLHLDPAHPDPQPGAVDRRPGDHREHQEPDGGGRERVFVRLQAAVVAQHEDERQESDQADDDPHRLVAGERRLEPVDLGQAERAQKRCERKEPRVGVRQAGPHADVGDREQGEKEPGVDQRGARDLVLAGGVHRREADGGQDAHHDQVHQLSQPR